MDRAWVYTLVYNEAELIAYWVRHHCTFAERVVVFVDVDSNDGTAEIAQREGAEVFSWQGIGLDDQTFVAFANATYPEAIGKTDWVAWLDADEFLYHPSIQSKLDSMHGEGITLPHTDYYVMVSDYVPTHPGQIYSVPELRKGIFVQQDAKIAVFDPNHLSMVWGVGKHTEATQMRGTVKQDSADPLQILHYRWLGKDYLNRRDARNYGRASPRNRNGRFGYHVFPEFVGPYMEGWEGPPPSSAVEVVKIAESSSW